jgi:hypothetical protein
MFRSAEATLELAVGTAPCDNVDVYLKRVRDDYVLELRVNCPLDFETEKRFPALLANHYGNRNGVALAVNRVTERDTIIRLSCAAID